MGTVLSSILKTVFKTGIKFALNAVCPGLGASVGIFEAFMSFYKGDYMGGIMSLGFTVIELFTLGMSAAARKAAVAAGKNIAIEAVREKKKQISKQLGRKAAKLIATGTLNKDFAVNFAKSETKQAGKILGRELGKDLRKGLLWLTTEQTFTNVTKTSALSVFREAVYGGIGSGGQNIMNEMFSSGTEEACGFVFELFTPKTAMPVFKSVGEEAVKKFATESAKSMQRNANVISAVTALATGVAKIISSNQNSQKESENQYCEVIRIL